jgi:hypothetical protein
MGFVSLSEAREFHFHQIRDGRQQDAVFSNSRRLGKIRHRFGILRPYFFSDEDKVYGASGAWRGSIHEHIHTRDMPVFQSDPAHSLGDASYVRPINCEINVLC